MQRPRQAASSAELVNGVTRADNYLNAEHSANAGGDTLGSPVYGQGVTFADGQRVEYDAVTLALPFSAVIRFATDVAGEQALIGNANLMFGQTQSGFCVWVDADGVRATYSDGATVETALEIDLTYADGEEHTVTYVVESGTHTLYVDDQNITAVTTTAGPLTSTVPLSTGGLLT